MSARIDAERRAAAREAAIQRSKRQRLFDAEVAKAFVDEEPVRATAQRLGVSVRKVMASRVWQHLETGRAHRRGVQPRGEIRSRVATLRAMRLEAP